MVVLDLMKDLMINLSLIDSAENCNKMVLTWRFFREQLN